MSERRKFTTDFARGDEVAIIRTEHGWYDGSLSARITHIEDYYCRVMDGEGCPHEIRKPRDIHLICDAISAKKEKKRRKLMARKERLKQARKDP